MAKINHGGKDILCTIVDSDQMTIDSFESSGSSSMDVEGIRADVSSKKVVFLADDSRVVRRLFGKVCTKLGVNHHIFENGKELLDAVTSLDIDEVGLIVTDIEMPVKSGQDVIRELRENKKFDDIKIIVHTNMANKVMEKELLDTGADAIVGKIDTTALANAIRANIR
ncbi:MAG: response regulator [Campylobacterota bacterium]|nr:response regulator [Campylobacterota bacterium]